MPPKTKQSRTKVADEQKPAEEVVFKPWKSGTKLHSGGDLVKDVSQWRVDTTSYSQSVEIHHNDQFTLEPLVITEGSHIGRHVLMLQPVKITDYFRFMDLSPELRKMVYGFVLLEQANKIFIDVYKAKARARRPVKSGFSWDDKRAKGYGFKWDKDQGKVMGRPWSGLSLLRVSKQLLAEAAPVIYGQHVFSFRDMSVMECFLSTIGEMRHFLKDIELDCFCYIVTKFRPAFKLLTNAKSLRTIRMPHNFLCPRTRAHGDKTISMESFVEETTAMLTCQHNLRKTREDNSTIFDLFTGLEPDPCYTCNGRAGAPGFEHVAGRPCDGRTACMLPCSALVKHGEEFYASLHAAIARVVGIDPPR
ncbi:hypothetical protein LTR10_006790 [Elasticomyces elasticus]|nr:hypothetical protein LTR10_006790 [Elasticomyces elasticus]KAK4972809.1 hypothetical protein LTR42_006103 [Elasticomyces elasticus]